MKLTEKGGRYSRRIAGVIFLVLLIVVFVPPGTYFLFEQLTPRPFHIQVGGYDVSLLTHNLSSGLYGHLPQEIRNHSVVESFVEEYHPIWELPRFYYNESVGAPIPVDALLLIALNQSGFWQFVVGFNESYPLTVVRWTCMVSGHNMPVDAFIILLIGVQQFVMKLPWTPIVLREFYLGWRNTSSTIQRVWRMLFSAGGLGDFFFVTVDTNGTIISAYRAVLLGNGPPRIILMFFVGIGVIGTALLILVAIKLIRTRRFQKNNRNQDEI